ncbi:MAG: 30S ribosomal protein S3, partial [Chloroflexi bacterium]|nr:30S ribosomal protein S3 [Chloroflexota bacterium]
MGQKVNPISFRLGYIRNWDTRWYADRNYAQLLKEDLALRAYLDGRLRDAAVSRTEIERAANQVTVSVHTARPGIVIGRGGSHVEELRKALEGITGKQVRLNIIEIRQPEIDATLVAKAVAEQLERRVAFRRAMKQAITRGLQRGAKGIKVAVAGRLGGAEMARRAQDVAGKVPLHTLRADIDYG